MLRARKTFFAAGGRRVRKGDIVAADDPIVAGREVLFEDVTPTLAPERWLARVEPPKPKRNRRRKADEPEVTGDVLTEEQAAALTELLVPTPAEATEAEPTTE